MPRPYAVIGLTLFAVSAVLYNASGTAVIVALAIFAALFALSLIVRTLREGRVFPVALASAAIACVILTVNNEFFFFPQLKTAGETHDITAVITSDVKCEYGNYYYEGRLLSSDGEKRSAKVRFAFSSMPEINPYDEVSGSFTFYALGSTAQSVADRYKTENRFLGAYPENNEYSVKPNESKIKPAGFYIISFRSWVKSTVMRILPNDYGALCLALLTGDRSELSPSVYASLTGSGVTHIICISGLHLSVWTSAILFILRKLKVREKLAAGITASFVIVIMAAAGMTFSVVRAGIMMLVYLASIILSRRRDPLNSLGIAITVIAVFNPFAMGAVSLRLSVLATLGIIIYTEYCAAAVSEFITSHRRIAVLKQPLQLLIVSAFALGFCLPVTTDVYGTVNFAVFPSNLLVVWAGEACMIVSVIGLIVAGIIPSVINIPGLVAGALAKYIIKVTEYISGLGFLNVRIDSSSAKLMMICIFLFCALAAFVAYTGKKLLPQMPFILAGLVAFCVMFAAVSAYNETRISVMDTGNGTAVLVSDKGTNVLFGCGGDTFNGAYTVSHCIEDAGGRIDAVVIPSDSPAASAYFYDICPKYQVDRYYVDGTVSMIGVRTDEENVFDASGGEEGTIMFEPLSAGNNTGYVITSSNAKITLLFNSGAGEITDGALDSDLLITRMSLPEDAEFPNLVYTVIQADNERGCALQDEMTSSGANAAATAGNGTVLIRARKGRMNLERI